MNIKATAIRKIRFTIWILFKPEVQIIINSLSFSNFKIVNVKPIKKQKGINFVRILDKDNRE